jgi:hypothetical protein
MSELYRRDTNLDQTQHDGDPSSKIWGLYLTHAAKVDKEHSNIWIGNTDSVLVFVRHESCHEIVLFSPRVADQTGLFSAVVATFLVVSYPLLQPNSTDTTNHLLTQIYQQSSNGTSSQPLPTANNSSFQTPASAVRVNALWFTSLATSTACALWATLVQQWVRKYMQLADRPYSPQQRALLRKAFAHGFNKFALAAAVEVLPALLHTSFLLFYVGLIDFLIQINHTVAYIMVTWVAIGLLIYFIVTIAPLLYPSSPYQTPLSPSCWFIMEATSFLWLWLRRKDTSMRRRNIWQGMRRTLELKAIEPTSLADVHTTLLRRTLKSLDEDHKLEEFLDGLPGLFHGSGFDYSTRLRGGLEELIEPVAEKLFATCTTAGGLHEKPQRLKACLKAIWCFSGTTDRHLRAICDQWDNATNDPWGPLSTETWKVASSMTTNSDPFTAIRAHCIQALMAVMWKRRKWECAQSEAVPLLERQLGASDDEIDRWLKSGDQLQLAVAANLLSKSLPHLLKLDNDNPGTDADKTLNEVFDKIFGELDASDLPEDLRARFAHGAEVMKDFNIKNVARHSGGRASILNGPWVEIFNTLSTISQEI